MHTYRKLIILIDTGEKFNSGLLVDVFKDCKYADVVLASDAQTTPALLEYVCELQGSNIVKGYMLITNVSHLTFGDKLRQIEHSIKCKKHDFDAAEYGSVIITTPRAHRIFITRPVCSHIIYSGSLRQNNFFIEISDIMTFFYLCKLKYYKKICNLHDVDEALDRFLFRADIPLFKPS